MSFDFSTLVTDRTQADVEARNDKGTYQAADLNRVTAAMKDLAERFSVLGYVTDYQEAQTGGGILPEGYTELEYIESSGTQYIDTGVYIQPTDSTKMDMEYVVSPNVQGFVFGSTESGDAPRYGVTYIPAHICWRNAHSVNYYDFPSTLPGVGRHLIQKNGTDCTIDGVQGNCASAVFTSKYTMFLFCRSESGTPARYSSMRLYSCKIQRGSNTLRDFIPVRTSAGIVGLYDCVSGQFYGNAGTGVFNAGPAVNYTALEYIESTGSQYIDTEFKPNQHTRLVLDAQMTNATSLTSMYCPIGVRDGKHFFELYKASTGNWGLAFLWGSTYTTRFTIDYAARHIFEINKNVATVDDESITYNAQAFQLTHSIFLCADNAAGSVTAMVGMRIYSCQIYDNDELIRDFIPCITADGQIGLHDRVKRKFYGNAGSGAFKAGPESPVQPQDQLVWSQYNAPTTAQMKQYLANVEALRRAIAVLPTTPATPESMELLDYIRANEIEQILADVDDLLKNMAAAWYYSGEVYCGEV